jgi:hypothetical protein
MDTVNPPATHLLVWRGDLIYTLSMRSIDPQWTDLSAGYETIQALQGRLEKEFGRAVKIGHERRFRHELTEWQKKRRIFFALAAFAPLSLIGLCASAYYFREVACVIVYWAVVVLTILVTLAVAGRNYIREAVNRPEPKHGEALEVDLEGRWWEGLSPKSTSLVKKNGDEGAGFAALLKSSLNNTYLTMGAISKQDGQELLLLGPSGIWVFVIRDWKGTVVKQEGVWHFLKTFHDRWGRKRIEDQVIEKGPDDDWLRRKGQILKEIEAQLPEPVGTRDLVQGGVVFTHPGVVLDKTRIQGNSAAYGPARAWVERLGRSGPVAGFTPVLQLKVMDLLRLGREADDKGASAKAEAERLYQEAAGELRTFVKQLVKE